MMIVHWFWWDCNFRGKEWGAAPIDAFWVEATREEADNKVLPKLQPAGIDESHKYAEQFIHLAEELRKPACPYTFLVARDLSTIDPFHVHYPFHQMWNGYTPFEVMEVVNIRLLEEVKTLVIPESQNGISHPLY